MVSGGGPKLHGSLVIGILQNLPTLESLISEWLVIPSERSEVEQSLISKLDVVNTSRLKSLSLQQFYASGSYFGAVNDYEALIQFILTIMSRPGTIQVKWSYPCC